MTDHIWVRCCHQQNTSPPRWIWCGLDPCCGVDFDPGKCRYQCPTWICTFTTDCQRILDEPPYSQQTPNRISTKAPYPQLLLASVGSTAQILGVQHDTQSNRSNCTVMQQFNWLRHFRFSSPWRGVRVRICLWCHQICLGAPSS